MSGKGSKPRPYSVSQKQFANNWDNVFNKKNNLTQRMQSEADLFSVKSSTTNKDWYLISINPWYKWYWNPKTDEHKHISYK